MIKLFFLIPFFLVFSLAYGQTEFRGEDYLDVDLGNGTHVWTGGLPKFIEDNGLFFNSIITENTTHIIMDSRTPIVVSKINCEVDVYAPDSLNEELQTHLDYQIHESFLTPTNFKKFPNQGFTKGCQASHFTNSSGSFINNTKTWTTTSNTFSMKNLIALFEDEELPESFHEISYNGSDTGKQYAFFIEARTTNTDKIKFDLNEYIIVGGQVEETDENQVVTTGDSITIELSNINEPIFTLVNPMLDTDMIFDLKKAEQQLKNVEILADSNELTIEARFYTSEGIELHSGGSLFLDPTFGFTSGSILVFRPAPAPSTTCELGATYAIQGTIAPRIADADDNNACWRTSYEWDITSIDDVATITNIDFRYTIIGTLAFTADACDYYAYVNQPSTLTAEQLWTGVPSGTLLVNADTGCRTIATTTLDLGASADGNLQANLVDDWWAIGIKVDDELRDSGSGHYTDFSTGELQVTYTLPPVAIIPKMLERDETTGVSGTISITNSSGTFSKTVNATNQQKFLVEPSTNQNFTMKEDTDNFVVRQTINNNTANYDLWTDAESPTFISDSFSCPNNGAGTDVTNLMTNATDGHHITSFTAPTCDTDDDISWSVLFTANGQDANSYSSIVRLEILSTGFFDTGSDMFTVNGTEIDTSYTEPDIVSSSFTVGDGTTDTLLNFVLSLDTIEPEDNGGGGGGGGGGGTTIIIEESSDPLTLNISSEIQFAVFGEFLENRKLNLEWENDDQFDLVVTEIIVADSPLTLTFQNRPFTVLKDEQIIRYNVNIPNVLCEGQQQVGCIQPTLYNIPITISGTINNEPVSSSHTVQVDLTNELQIPFLAVLAIIASVPIILIIKKYSKKGSPKHSYSNRRSSNGTAKALISRKNR